MTSSQRRATALVAATTCLVGPLAAPPAASSDSSTKACGKIGFTPNSDDVADDIRMTKGFSCRRARKVVRDVFRNAERLRYDAPEGFSCRGRRAASQGLPYVRWRCVNGLAVITWKKF